MAQLSVRLDDDLHRRAKFAAQSAGTSLNAYIARVLSVAVEPSASEPENERIRQRLFEAGLLPSAEVPPAKLWSPAEQAAFDAAYEASAGGTLASELIAAERRER